VVLAPQPVVAFAIAGERTAFVVAAEKDVLFMLLQLEIVIVLRPGCQAACDETAIAATAAAQRTRRICLDMVYPLLVQIQWK
jgi:hypothetical protein